MKFKGDRKYIYYGVMLFFVTAASILFYYLLNHWANVTSLISKFCSIMMPIIDGLVVAYLLAPAVGRLESLFYNKISPNHEYTRKGKNRIRVGAIVVTLAFFIFLIVEFFRLVIPELYNSIVNISVQFPNYVNNLENFFQKLLSQNPELEKNVNSALAAYSDSITDWLNTSVIPQLSSIFKAVTNGIVLAVKTVFNLIVGLIISIYVLYNKEIFKGQAKKIFYAIMKRDTANIFIHNLRFMNKTFSGFIVGKIVDSILIGLICFIVTTIVGTPYATLISVIVGVTNIIPFFGPFIGAIPSGLLVLMVDPMECLYFVIIIVVLQQFDGNILGPKIIGNTTGLSGFWVIFAITVFGGLFGVLGMLVGVPIFAVFYAGFKAYIKAKLQEKDLAWETKKYINVDYIDENTNYINIPKEQIVNVSSKRQNILAKFKKNSENNVETNVEKNCENNVATNAETNVEKNTETKTETNTETNAEISIETNVEKTAK